MTSLANVKSDSKSHSVDQVHSFLDMELARRLEGAEADANSKWVEARARVFPESGARWIEVAGARAMFDGVSSPVTQTFGLGMFGPVTIDVLETMESFFEERGAPVDHEVCPLAGINGAASLAKRGYEPIEFSNVLYRPIGPGFNLSLRHIAEIQARPIVKGEEGIWAETAAKGWGELPEVADFIRDLAPMTTQREGSVSFLAEMDGRTIAVGALFVSARVGLLAGACTIPEARRRGAQLALLDARLRHAAKGGCDLAMMCAAPGSASQRNAERHGFRVAYTRTKWRLARQSR